MPAHSHDDACPEATGDYDCRQYIAATSKKWFHARLPAWQTKPQHHNLSCEQCKSNDKHVPHPLIMGRLHLRKFLQNLCAVSSDKLTPKKQCPFAPMARWSSLAASCVRIILSRFIGAAPRVRTLRSNRRSQTAIQKGHPEFQIRPLGIERIPLPSMKHPVLHYVDSSTAKVAEQC